MKANKKLWIIIGLVAFVLFSRVNYYNKFKKVDEQVIQGVAEYTMLIESSRMNDLDYELREKLEVAKSINEMIPVNEISRREIELIGLVKVLNDSLYMIHYHRNHDNIEEETVYKEKYEQWLNKIKAELTPYRGKVKEVDELWEQGIFSD